MNKYNSLQHSDLQKINGGWVIIIPIAKYIVPTAGTLGHYIGSQLKK